MKYTYVAGVIIFALLGCGSQTVTEWQDADGYRWRELRVPRRGPDGFRQLSLYMTGITFTNSVTKTQLI